MRISLDGFEGLDGVAAGTLLLRGVEDLTADAQSALLDLMDRRPDLRVISSTHVASSVLADRLRHDLSSASQARPSTCRRSGSGLISAGLSTGSCGCIPIIRLPCRAAELQVREWPGNLRELERALQVATALAETQVVDLPDLPPPVIRPDDDPDARDQLETVLIATGWNMAQGAAAWRQPVDDLAQGPKAGLAPPQ
ncbi:MAG: hypothetical protein R3D87_11950 [Paracoccaceae bacterium]